MAKQSFPVLITRPAPQAARLAAELVARLGAQVTPVIAPLMQAEALAPELPQGPFAGLVLTSETGAEAAGALCKSGSVQAELAWCVGDRTAEAATAQGFCALSAGGDARDLAALIRGQPDEGPLLYLHGEDRAADLAALLPERRIHSVAVYAQRPLPLSPEARALLARPGPVILPLYSPRSARLAISAITEPVSAEILPVAISPAARDALPPRLAASATVADRPDGAAMLEAIARVISSRLP